MTSVCFIQATVEVEGNSKAEIIRTNKKLEADIRELEMALDRVSGDKCELQTKVKNQFLFIRDMEQQMMIAKEEKQRLSEIIHTSDRKVKALSIQVEDFRIKYEQSEKTRRQVQLELNDNKETVNEMISSRDGSNVIKRKLENSVVSLQTELEECVYEMKNAEDKVKRAMGDAAKMAEDLKAEQERSLKSELDRKKSEQLIKELKVGFIVKFYF